MPGPGGVPGPRGAWSRGVPGPRGVPGRGVPGGHPPGQPLLQVVRILLECILVVISFLYSKTIYNSRQYKEGQNNVSVTRLNFFIYNF